MLTLSWSKLVATAATTALITLGIGAASASAINFNFEGNRIKGSYKIDDAVYNSWLSAASTPQYDESGIYRAFIPGTLGLIRDFKLFLDGVELDYSSNLNISEIFATRIDYASSSQMDYDRWEIVTRKGLDGQKPSAEDFKNGLTGNWQEFGLVMETIGGTVHDCLGIGKVCSSTVTIVDSFLKSNSPLTETVKHYVTASTNPGNPAPNPGDPVKSVPEPTSVLGFLLVGSAFALKNKKKSAPVAISAKSA